jgi:hypothetical protein
LPNGKLSGEVYLSNPGTRTCSYRASLVGLDMDADGKVQERPLEHTPGQAAIQDLVRVAPKQMTLNPKEGQTVRIQLRNPSALAPGEYRLHLLMRQEPAATPDPPSGNEGSTPAEISTHLTALMAVTIPVIIRLGNTSAQVAITGLALDADRTHLTGRLERTGNRSVYGNLKVTYYPSPGLPKVLSQADGLAVYTPNAYRNISFNLRPSGQEPRLGAGRLEVTYTSTPEDGGARLAEGSLNVP